MQAALTRPGALFDANRHYYDSLWSGARLVEPHRFNTWPLVQSLLPACASRLEIAPGLRPRLPIEGTHFVDLSAPAIAKLGSRGASVAVGLVTSLPFPDAIFDMVCAFDIVEHVEDDAAALGEISRVAKPGAAILISVPLHPARWTAFDDFVGHCRRYEPERLVSTLSPHGLDIERSAAYGMQPKSSRLLDLGMWWLTHQRARALWWYNRVFMPLGLRFQKGLIFGAGLIDSSRVDEILMVCRKSDGARRPGL
ncbi:MAG TPA: class I SAM-dependent methyltransferase [Steroidobacteraceae bacterium]|jgi:SAM-dependent methyltransferase|nr:class I SAM-dependent methyltransferase [Steroidobacteraceae bacterium]